jgi:hypothetical protein
MQLEETPAMRRLGRLPARKLASRQRSLSAFLHIRMLPAFLPFPLFYFFGVHVNLIGPR